MKTMTTIRSRRCEEVYPGKFKPLRYLGRYC